MDFQTTSQLAVDGFINGCAYGLLGVAFALILSVTGRFHFAFAVTYTITAYIAAVLATDHGVPVIPAIVLGLAAGVVLGVACEMLVYRPLGERSGSKALLVIFVASLGISIAGQSLVTLLWGLDTQTRNLTAVKVETITVAEVTFVNLDLISVGVIAVCVLGLAYLLRSTDLGRHIKAVRSNPLLAQVVGIDSPAVYRKVFAIGSLLAGVAAVLFLLKYAATPEMGQRPIFYALVVAFLGGAQRSPVLVGLTGIGLGLIESLSGIWVSAQWSSMVVFGVLFLYLVQRATSDAGLWQTLRARSRALISRPATRG
jgi:branched-chain amino acid transport system permease protein